MFSGVPSLLVSRLDVNRDFAEFSNQLESRPGKCEHFLHIKKECFQKIAKNTKELRIQ